MDIKEEIIATLEEIGVGPKFGSIMEVDKDVFIHHGK